MKQLKKTLKNTSKNCSHQTAADTNAQTSLLINFSKTIESLGKPVRQTQDFATNVCRAWPVHIECILDDIRCSQNDAGEQERIGYKVELKGPGALTLDGFFALMGCFQPLNSTDRGCGPSVTYVHINVDVWTEGYAENWVQIQANYPNKAPKPQRKPPSPGPGRPSPPWAPCRQQLQGETALQLLGATPRTPTARTHSHSPVGPHTVFCFCFVFLIVAIFSTLRAFNRMTRRYHSRSSLRSAKWKAPECTVSFH